MQLLAWLPQNIAERKAPSYGKEFSLRRAGLEHSVTKYRALFADLYYFLDLIGWEVNI
jgi:hypothetical protein